MENSKKALKHGHMRFYFPEYPDHPFNGCFAHSTSSYTGEINGRKTRSSISTFEASSHNLSSSPGYWKGEIKITTDDFESEEVLVKQWYSDGFNLEPEYFYLTSPN